MSEHKMSFRDLKINSKTVLFLDRDGVINYRRPNDYVKSISEFKFLPGVQEAIALFSKIFYRIFIVTNQQGIGKGLMSKEDLATVHRHMLHEISLAEGKIDAVFYCDALAQIQSINRKPQIGMALQALQQFPDISLQNAVMVGDSESDVAFGKRAGMYTIFLNQELTFSPKEYGEYPDAIVKDLDQLAKKISQHIK